MRDVIQPDLDGIQLWCDRNCLKLSITKSKTLLIGSISRLNNVDYTGKLSLAGTELPFVQNYCYLGILLDKYISLTGLVSTVKKNVANHLFKLWKICRIITTKCAIDIYKQTILPLFDYAGFMLYSINQSDKNDLQVYKTMLYEHVIKYIVGTDSQLKIFILKLSYLAWIKEDRFSY